jgi:hypothetical protein
MLINLCSRREAHVWKKGQCEMLYFHFSLLNLPIRQEAIDLVKQLMRLLTLNPVFMLTVIKQDLKNQHQCKSSREILFSKLQLILLKS